jgi:hypothetical protein
MKLNPVCWNRSVHLDFVSAYLFISEMRPELLTPLSCSAPEEDYLSCHIRVEGDWTTAFAKVLGCDFQKKGGGDKGKSKDKAIDLGKSKDAVAVQTPLNRYLPRVMIDGPFGSASEDFNKFETVLLVGGQ